MPAGTTAARGYNSRHKTIRARWVPVVAAGQARCARCGEPIVPGEAWDLGHVDGSRSRHSGPEHRRCNRATATHVATARRSWLPPEPLLERDGIPAGDERWRVPWLKRLLKPPADAVWPRYMTVPHPSATGSLGDEFTRWVKRRGGSLRWWQRLVATRLLETDAAGELVWGTLILSMARQLGKSWLLRELLLWRIHQGDRFGEPQLVMHTGREREICNEVQRSARAWAKQRDQEYRTRESNGQEEIKWLHDGSRWLVRAKTATTGYTVSCAAVDEAWDVPASRLDEDLVPTLVASKQPQLLLISTAHRLATSLMLERRLTALKRLETGDGALLIEWSAPRDADLDDVRAWRLASPHWTRQRQQLLTEKLESLRLGEFFDPDEPDPEQAVRSQWLNQWPLQRAPRGRLEPLLPAGVWDALAEPELDADGPVWLALEDGGGRSAAIAAVAQLDDGRFEVDGWLCHEGWDAAVAEACEVAMDRPVREILVGASLLNSVNGVSPAPKPAGSRETRTGLALLRDLVAGGLVVHNSASSELAEAVAAAQVTESPSGLFLPAKNDAHLVRALVWALRAAHKPAKVPALL